MDNPSEGARILIVDDEPETRRLLGEILATQGYRTDEAGSGAVALAHARSFPPDLVLLDVNLFQVDGLEVCRHLKADPRTAHVPILIVTGMDQTEVKDEAMRAGADDYVAKPVQAADLLSRVRVLLRVGNLRRDLDREIASLRAQRAHGGGAAP